MLRLALAATVLLLAGQVQAAGTWRPLDPETTLVVDTSKGRIIVEMRPDLAPLAMARVKLLAREHVYDGLLFHRVIDHFVDQTGNPNNKDGGVSSHPDLPPEFTARLKPGDFVHVTEASDRVSGFLGATPVESEQLAAAARRPDGTLRIWGAYCPGVVGMGRQEAPGSANSEIFFMRDASRRLDRDYTVWGRVVVGLDVVRAVAIGEPPPDPDRMLRVRMLADIPPGGRLHVEVMDEHSAAFRARVARVRAAEGADFSICDIEIPVRP